MGNLSTISFYTYTGVCKKVLRGAKYLSIRSALAALCNNIPDSKFTDTQNNIPRHSVIVPIPLHTTRLKNRGFNQSDVIASIYAQKLGMHIKTDLLVRSKQTPPQAQLCRKERLNNIIDAFSIAKNTPCPSSIILVDDVLTTGATLQAARKTLMQNGRCHVSAITLARSG